MRRLEQGECHSPLMSLILFLVIGLITFAGAIAFSGLWRVIGGTAAFAVSAATLLRFTPAFGRGGRERSSA